MINKRYILHIKTGSSLVEVMIAMVILGFGLLGIMGSLTIGDDGLSYGNKLLTAIGMTQEKIEYKKGLSFNDLLNDDLDRDGLIDATMVDDGRHGDKIAGDGIYTYQDYVEGIKRRWMIQDNGSGMVTIRVVSSWINRRGKEKSFELITMRTDGVVH
ncbi:MAG: choice-of-anchor X domain-containing protein [Nitrospirota bacterium]